MRKRFLLFVLLFLMLSSVLGQRTGIKYKTNVIIAGGLKLGTNSSVWIDSVKISGDSLLIWANDSVFFSIIR